MSPRCLSCRFCGKSGNNLKKTIVHSTHSACNVINGNFRWTSDHNSIRSSYRFKHCQFLKAMYQSRLGSEDSSSSSTADSPSITPHESPIYLLATTIQPLCANRKSVSRLVVWLVPDISKPPGDESSVSLPTKMDESKPTMLTSFADVALPQGHLPACMSVHPGRCRCLIGVGTMDGRVDVYLYVIRPRFFSHRQHPGNLDAFWMRYWQPALGRYWIMIGCWVQTFDESELSLLLNRQAVRSFSQSRVGWVSWLLSRRNRTLTCVYSMNNAHPIFVTALTFLPPFPWPEINAGKPKSKYPAVESEESFELVSVSVDRALRWHQGPSYARIGRLARCLYDPESRSLWSRYALPLLSALVCLIFVFLIPIHLAIIDAALIWSTLPLKRSIVHFDRTCSQLDLSYSPPRQVRSVLTSFRCIDTILLEGNTEVEILPGCPNLDRSSQDAEVDFEPQTFRSVS
ncbi:hypothetical protein T265_05491 [Opisthorchis viverrini]|uniref:Uncharacterized protein n=1 Tax=Opisthorchis viverrini TaxID=6198 RepID=A0A074ZVP1_OPIVI|nr:hypothetical protein T265_05491 [Opisthorchis viverrini]KER27450.1 hypothetical protein T265_05491 [Opisthorchis viverrini]